jgi:hypothetical protein
MLVQLLMHRCTLFWSGCDLQLLRICVALLKQFCRQSAVAINGKTIVLRASDSVRLAINKRLSMTTLLFMDSLYLLRLGCQPKRVCAVSKPLISPHPYVQIMAGTANLCAGFVGSV